MQGEKNSDERKGNRWSIEPMAITFFSNSPLFLPSSLFQHLSGRGLETHRRHRGQLRRYPPEQARDRGGELFLEEKRKIFFFHRRSRSLARSLPLSHTSDQPRRRKKKIINFFPRPQPASSPSTTSTRAASSPAGRLPETPSPPLTLRSRAAAAAAAAASRGEEEWEGKEGPGSRRGGSRR